MDKSSKQLKDSSSETMICRLYLDGAAHTDDVQVPDNLSAREGVERNANKAISHCFALDSLGSVLGNSNLFLPEKW